MQYFLTQLAILAVVLVVTGLAWVVVFAGWEALSGWRRGRRQRQRLAEDRYAAERLVREVRRQAVREMLAVERSYHQSDPDVIDGTAVEIRP